jgi:hypothetical protein
VDIVLTEKEKELILKIRRENERKLQITNQHYTYDGLPEENHFSQMNFKVDNAEYVQLHTQIKHPFGASGFFRSRIYKNDAKQIVDFLNKFLRK